MPTNAVAENVLGTIGTICWTIQIIPQIWKSWREKSTKGLSHHLILLWAISRPFMGAYVVVQELNIPLIVQPHLFTLLCLVSWAQCQYYGNRRSLGTSVMLYMAALCAITGFELALFFLVKPAHDSGNNVPAQVLGILTSILIAAALLPQYYEIYKHGEVIGISILFMFIDMSGGVFSDLSLMFKEEIDVMAAVTYSLVVLLDGIVLLLAAILNPIAKRRRQKDAARQAAASSRRSPATISPAIHVPNNPDV